VLVIPDRPFAKPVAIFSLTGALCLLYVPVLVGLAKFTIRQRKAVSLASELRACVSSQAARLGMRFGLNFTELWAIPEFQCGGRNP
jgi:hypothetical protein